MKRRGVEFLVGAEEQEVGDRQIVQPAGHARMQPDTVQRVAEDNRLPQPGVEERLDTELIPGAEETMLKSVPDRKREVTEQTRHAVVAPRAIGAQNQLRIRGVRVDL